MLCCSLFWDVTWLLFAAADSGEGFVPPAPGPLELGGASRGPGSLAVSRFVFIARYFSRT